MSVSILETLQNAKFNLVDQKIPGISDMIGAEQLSNAISLLVKGYSIYHEVQPLLDKYGTIDNIPHCNYPIDPLAAFD